MIKLGKSILLLSTVAIVFSGCGMMNSKDMIVENSQQLELRSYQIKKYDKSKILVSRAVMSSLQDLNFIIDKADLATGTITATKIVKGASMRMTVVVRELNDKNVQVRTNAQFSSFNSMPEAVTDPEMYQSFYAALDKAIFLEKEGL